MYRHFALVQYLRLIRTLSSTIYTCTRHGIRHTRPVARTVYNNTRSEIRGVDINAACRRASVVLRHAYVRATAVDAYADTTPSRRIVHLQYASAPTVVTV